MQLLTTFESQHPSPLSQGEIASCAGPSLYLWTMKGQLLTRTDTSCGPQADILCVGLTQRHEWDARNVIVTGCADGVVRVSFLCAGALQMVSQFFFFFLFSVQYSALVVINLILASQAPVSIGGINNSMGEVCVCVCVSSGFIFLLRIVIIIQCLSAIKTPNSTLCITWGRGYKPPQKQHTQSFDNLSNPL